METPWFHHTGRFFNFKKSANNGELDNMKKYYSKNHVVDFFPDFVNRLCAFGSSDWEAWL
jgi:hypothetical protein